MKQVFSLDEYKWHVDHEARTLTLTKREETAQQWVKRIYQACCEDKSRSGASIAGRYTVIVDDKGNIGKSICHPLDKQDMQTGVAIAYARLRNIPIHPDFLPKCTVQSKPSVAQPHVKYEEDSVVYDTRTGDLGVVKRSNGRKGTVCVVQFTNGAKPILIETKYLCCYTD